MRIFSGRTVKRPTVRRSSTFETPTNPAMNSLAGCSYTSAGVPICSILPVVEHREAVAHRERLLLVVRHVDERDPELLLELLQLDLELLAELEVERTERLVQQQSLRAIHERPSKRDPLPLAARQLRGLAAAVAPQAHELERLSRAPPPLVTRHLLHAQSVLHVLLNRHVREERVVLEDRVDVPRVGRQVRDVAPAELDRPLVGPLEAGYHPQRGRLAGARRAEHREELTAANLEVDAVDRDDVAVPLAKARDSHVDLSLRRQAPPRATRARARAPRRSP